MFEQRLHHAIPPVVGAIEPISAIDKYTDVKPIHTMSHVQTRPAVPPFARAMLRPDNRDSQEHIRMALKPNIVTSLKFR